MKDFELSKKQLIHFVLAFMDLRKREPLSEEGITLKQLVDECHEDSMMFASWFDGANVMD